MRTPIFLLLLLIGGIPPALAGNDEVNLYSARMEALIKPLLDQFTEETGIKVNLVTGKASALLKRLVTEGSNSPADLFITTDAGRLFQAKEAGVLQPVSSKQLHSAVPASLRDPQGYWYGLSLRARPIFYVKGKVEPQQLSTYEALADPQWQGRICIRSSSNIYNQSLVASMIAAIGEQQTEEWAKAFVGNFARPPKGGDKDQIKAAAAGLCDIAIVNTYYAANMLTGKDQDLKKAAQAVALFWPNQDDRGAHVNVSGIGMTSSARNSTAALRLMEYLASEEAQRWYAEANQEYPVRPGVAASPELQSWGEFKSDSIELVKLGELNATALKLMDRAGWK
jgi:iron(III) transport system substrate-binding protein